MVKYDDFKLRVVQFYLNGEGGYKALTRSLGIPQESIVRRWVQSYKGNCLDNSPMENFFGIIKQEMYHGKNV